MQKLLSRAVRLLENGSGAFGSGVGRGGGNVGRARNKPHTRTSDACRCCGGMGHIKMACPKRNERCRRCDMVGHLASTCRQKASSEPNASTNNSTQRTTVSVRAPVGKDTCLCCGKTGHSKAECSKSDAVCRTCSKTRHLAVMCWKAEAEDAGVESMKCTPCMPGISFARALTGSAGSLEKMWQCIAAECGTWMLSKDTKCTSCKKQKPTQQLPEEEQAVKQTTQATQQKPGMKLSKVEGEMTGRLLLGGIDAEGDVELGNDAYQMPEETKKLTEERAAYEELLKQMKEKKAPAEVIKSMQEALDKMPKPKQHQAMRDATNSLRTRLEVTEAFQKLDGQCIEKEAALAQEEALRAANREKEIDAANEEHRMRVAKIEEQHALHVADMKRRAAENAAKRKALKAEMEERLERMEQVLAKAAAAEPSIGQALARNHLQPQQQPQHQQPVPIQEVRLQEPSVAAAVAIDPNELW